MSRILLLMVFLVWMAGATDAAGRPPEAPGIDPAIFVLFYPALVLLMGLWGRLAARQVARGHSQKPLRRFHSALQVARILIPLWFGFGVFMLGWGWLVEEKLGLGNLGSIRLPGLIVGTLPPVLAWMGLWWAQFPAERTIREQHVWDQLDDGVPIHGPPTFRNYFSTNLRLQVLFTLVPVLMIVALRDLAAVTILDRLNHHAAGSVESRQGGDDAAEFLTFLLSSGAVFIFAPQVLRRVLSTSPLQDGPLRRRLESLCRRTGMRCRDILVWHTQFNMGNAAVMGVVPGMRYVLLSDLLLERMDDEQIEAVFAHEIGHVVHRHMIWYVVFFLTIVLGAMGPATMLDRFGISQQAKQLLAVLVSAGAFWLLFGFVSRRFERQADVFAARVLEASRAGAHAAIPSVVSPLSVYDTASHVGQYGATLFASALHRVATINNIPLSPRSRRQGGILQHVGYIVGSFMDLAHDWLHGSIPSRMAYLQNLSGDPKLTSQFDRLMSRLYAVMIFALLASAAWTWMASITGGHSS